MTHTPQWLQDRQAEYARAAQIRTCECGAVILAGLDSDVAALKVEIDPTPITQMGEAVALMNGRATFDLTKAKGARQIHRRADHNIRSPRVRPVYPEHQCDAPLDEHLDTRWATPQPDPDHIPDGFPF